VAALLPLTAVAQQSLKIGVFDAEKASRMTIPGQELHKKLNAQGDEFQTQLETLQGDLQRLQEQYQSSSLSLSDEKRRDLERQIEAKQIEFQTKQQTFLRERQRDVSAAQEEWSLKVRDVVEAIGREGSYDLLLPAELVPYYSQAVDITDLVIDRMGRSATPTPAEPE